MKKLLLALGLALTLTGTASAALYKISSVSRIDFDLYYSQLDRVVIETQFCHEFANMEDVIYDDTRNILVFEKGRTCTVKRIYSR